MKNIKSIIIKGLLLNDGVNITPSIKQHVGTLVPVLLKCDTCGALDYKDTIHIVFNEKFYNALNYAERRFCILHELGHYSSSDKGYERNIYSEVSADSYAFKHMGYDAAIRAMKGIIKKLPKEAIKEFNERMKIQVNIEFAKQIARSTDII